MLITYCLRLFVLWVPLFEERKQRYSVQKVIEFGRLMIDILVCKFEMYIFNIAQVVCENVRIAFLYVLSI